MVGRRCRIEFAPSAAKALKRLPPDVRSRLVPRIGSLADQVQPADVTKLQGLGDLYRIRAGDYRIVYQIRDRVLLVLVVKVGHSSDIHR